MAEILIGTLLILSRLYVVYWMYQGIYEVTRVGVNRWSVVYTIALITYGINASISTFAHDLSNPTRLIGSLAGGIIITILVRALRKKNGE